MGNKKKFLYLVLVLNIFFAQVGVVHAQLQTFDFSANNAESYQCFDKETGEILADPVVATPDEFGNYYCMSGGEKIIAQLKPPTLQQLEVWFVRIIYAIWGLVASLSFLFLVKLGYEYIISRGDPTKITEVRKKIVSYLIGFSLVFLAIPILTTAFRLLGVNTNAQCYNVNMPGFRFFYTSLCTDPKGVIAARFAADPCDAFSSGTEPEGVICKGTSYEGQSLSCGLLGVYEISLACDIQSGDSAATWCKTRRLTLPLFGQVFCDSSCNPSEC